VRVVLDPSACRIDGGRVLLAGSPLTLFRLGPAGQQAVEAIAAGQEVPPGAQPLVDRLIDTGAAHPRPAGERFTAADVTVVIPVHGQDPSTVLSGVGPAAAVVIVDDASQPPVAGPPSVTVLRHDVNQGPAAARTTGVATVTTPLVAFVDADCRPTAGWLAPLLAHFDDDRVALAAPRITTEPTPGTLARYDAVRNPLDLGPSEARIAPGTRVSYVPGAALVVRVAALEAVGGFDRTMRVGEDVDLVWRLVERGWRCRYEPRSVVTHRPRSSLRGFVRQRAGYGRSAAALDRRHPGAVPPTTLGPWTAAAWGLAALGHPAVGAAAGMVPAAKLRRALPPGPERDVLALRLTAGGLLRGGEPLASAITRAWWPPALVAGLAVRRLRGPLAAAAVLPPLIDWVRGRRASSGGLDPLRYLALRLLDDASYGAGVWAGAIEWRRAGPLLPGWRRGRSMGISRAAVPDPATEPRENRVAGSDRPPGSGLSGR
jgi:mycofactocin system glycosyltransferase